MPHNRTDSRRARPRILRPLRGATLSATIMLGAASTGCEPRDAPWLDGAVPEPTIFAPGVVSTDQREYGIAFTPDGREAYFTRRGRRGPSLIYVTRWSDEGWSEPVPAPFALERDQAPHITADGATMYFASRRPARGSWDRSENIWVMSREADGWSEPEPLAGTVNQPRSEIGEFSTGTEAGAFVLASGAMLYWTRVDPDWGSDLYVAEPDGNGGFVDPRPLRVNSFGDESNPAMSPDGRHLVFQGYRGADAHGGEDLYASQRTEYGWSDPRLLPWPINTADDEGWPSFSPDGRFFFFASDRDARSGYYDIFVVDYAALGLGEGDGHSKSGEAVSGGGVARR